MNDPSGRFSVIIPTLQRAEELPSLVDLCIANDLVHEVIVINNAQLPLHWEDSKVRVLDQAANIYVNPAWNLGAREATGEFIAIINDDLLFDAGVFQYVAGVLQRGRFGIVGPDRSAFHRDVGQPRHRWARRNATWFGFGTFMAMRRTDYMPIPENLKIWFGDDWLVRHSKRPPAALSGFRFVTDMGTTSSSPEMQRFIQRERAVADELLPPIEGSRWWHGPDAWLEAARNAVHRLRQLGRHG